MTHGCSIGIGSLIVAQPPDWVTPSKRIIQEGGDYGPNGIGNGKANGKGNGKGNGIGIGVSKLNQSTLNKLNLTQE